LAALAALSFTYTIERAQSAEPGGVTVVFEEPPIAAPRESEPQPPRAEALTIAAQDFALPEAPPFVAFGDAVDMAMHYTGPAEIVSPRWIRRPNDLSRYYPQRALRFGVEGDAVLDCLVTTQGALRCMVASETPAGWGFGAAALRISHDHEMAPAVQGGVAIQGRYRMRVPFQLQ
jgi:protein TonB